MSAVILASAAAGALWNRIRGDGITGGRYANAVAFGTLVGIGSTPLTGALAAVAMAVGQAPGWGRYIGALGGWEERPLFEWAPVDALIKGLKPGHAWFLPSQRAANILRLRAWGATGLALRGLFWGGLIGLATLSIWPALAGLAMPLCYAAAMVAARLYVPYGDNRWQGLSWEWGEYAFGAVLWGATALALMAPAAYGAEIELDASATFREAVAVTPSPTFPAHVDAEVTTLPASGDQPSRTVVLVR